MQRYAAEPDKETMIKIGDSVYRTSHHHTSTQHFAYVYHGGEIVGTININHTDESVILETPNGDVDVGGYSDWMALGEDAWHPLVERLATELGHV